MATVHNLPYLFSRIAIAVLGVIILAAGFGWIGVAPVSTDNWNPSRVATVLIGVSLILASLVLFIRPMQVWLMRSMAFRAISPESVMFLSLIQAVLFCAGLSVCIVVISADWLGLDPTPGFGKVRALQLATGLSLLLATYLLHSKPLQRAVCQLIGRYYLSHLQILFLTLTRWMLLIAGLITVFLVAMADVLRIDPTPGWSEDRIIHLFVGLSFLLAFYALKSRSLNAWVLRTSGTRLLSPMQISVLLVVRVLVLVAGVTVSGLVIFADVLGIDPTPGWGMPRFLQLLAGLALLLSGFVLHNRRLWSWLRRSSGRVGGRSGRKQAVK